jgi:aminopeptidase N
MSPRVGLALGMFVAACASSAQAQSAGAPSRPFHVIHYDARVEPDIATQTVRGSVRLDIVVTTDNQDLIDLDRGNLVVDSVREGRTPQTFTQTDRHLLIQLSHATHSGERRTIEVDYHGAPRFGLRFFPDRSQVYTVFSTSQWMVCVDAPEDRSTLRLRMVLPRDLSVIASGKRVGRRALTNGTVEHEWRTARAVPTYTFGFAAGRFNELAETHHGITLRYLADGLSTADLRRVFRDTAGMIAFFQDRAGIPYEGAYSQVLVAETIGQEMAGFAILPESFGRSVLGDEASVALGAHELAHQWWGNMVTCRDFTHFWLNEGFATFMAAAYDEQRFGRQRYLQDIDTARRRYEAVRDSGHDRSLVFPDWNRPSADDRTLVYRKGAYVLHLLREELGERAFWDGLRHYTRMYFGKSVTTGNFQQAMEQSSGRDLAAFFSKWVYLQ